MLNIRSLTCNPLQERCYLAWREAPRCVLVDPGCYGDDELRLLGKILTEEGLRPEAILLTHAHFDHVYAVKALQDRFGGIPVYLHPDDARQLRFCSVVPRMMGFPEPDTDFTRTDLAEGPLSVAGMDFEVIATPGHSPGSVCYLEREAGNMFMALGRYNGSRGRSPYPNAVFGAQRHWLFDDTAPVLVAAATPSASDAAPAAAPEDAASAAPEKVSAPEAAAPETALVAEQSEQAEQAAAPATPDAPAAADASASAPPPAASETADPAAGDTDSSGA